MFVMAAKDISKKDLQSISKRIEKQMEKWNTKDSSRDQKRGLETANEGDCSSVELDSCPSSKKRKTDAPTSITVSPDLEGAEKIIPEAQSVLNTCTNAGLNSQRLQNDSFICSKPHSSHSNSASSSQNISELRDISSRKGRSLSTYSGPNSEHNRTLDEKFDKHTDFCDIIIDVDKKGRCNFDIVSHSPVINVVPVSTEHDKQAGEDQSRDANGTPTDTEITYKDNREDKSNASRLPKVIGLPYMSQIVALDCEFVGLGEKGRISAIGRCSIVDFHGNVICDVYAHPEARITDYRTRYSGLHRRNMWSAIPLQSALNQIAEAIVGKIVVGHSVKNDFDVLKLPHPASDIRDTASYRPLQHLMNKDDPGAQIQPQVSLKKLAAKLLGRRIQCGPHCSVEDATATMDVYKLVWREWETHLRSQNITSSKTLNGNNLCNGQNRQRESYLLDKFWPEHFKNGQS